MESIHLKLLVEKKMKREIQILYILYDECQGINGNEIAMKLGISLSTVLSDLESLKIKIPDNWVIKLKKNIGYTLKIGKGISISTYTRQLLLSSPLFVIGKSIFNNDLCSVEDWEDRLYISESTLKRYLAIFKSVLKEYNLKMSMNPINIIGSEVNIRLFYFDLFYSSSKVSQLETLKPKELEFFNRLYSIISFDNLQYYRSMYWVMIVIRRFNFGNEVEINEELWSLISSKWDTNMVNNVENSFLKVFQKNISKNEIIFFYLIRWDTLILNESDKGINIEIVNEKIKKLVKILILESISELSINTYVFPHVFSYFEIFFNHLVVMSKLSPNFQKSNEETNHFSKITHPELHNFWLEKLVENKEIFIGISTIFFEDLASQLTMLTYPFLMKYNQNPKHIVFIIDTSVVNLNYLTALAKRYVMNNVRVSIMSNMLISEEVIEKINPELIVSNIEIETSKRIFYISDLPTEIEWKSINKIIFNMDEF